MFDHLAGKDAAQRLVFDRLQIREQVLLHHFEALILAPQKCVRTALDANGRDAPLAKHLKELATTTSEVSHFAGIAKAIGVGDLTLADGVFRPPKLLFKTEIIELRL